MFSKLKKILSKILACAVACVVSYTQIAAIKVDPDTVTGVNLASTSDYLTFTAKANGSTVTLISVGSPSWTGSYSTDGTSWSTYTPGTTGAITLTNINDKVMFKGDIGADFSSISFGGGLKHLQFNIGGNVAASGNINSIYTSTNFSSLTTLAYGSCFYHLFYNESNLTDVSDLLLPATTLSDYCYKEMFYGCSFNTAPVLPATTLSVQCYADMFHSCTNLTTMQSILPATVLTDRCYMSMFNGCTALTNLPALPATTVNDHSYANMFEGCTSISSVPVDYLPAETLDVYCYNSMFKGCTSLTNLPALPATTLENSCYLEMFNGCSLLTYVPELPATTLATNCYTQMFQDCTSLRVSSTSTASATYAWVLPSTGTYANTVTQTNMFLNCLETRSSGDTFDNQNGLSFTFYTQNPPVKKTVSSSSTTVGERNNYSHKLTVSVANGNIGKVSGSGIYGFADKVTITAEAEKGYTFEKWSDGDTSSTRTISMPIENITYEAIFIPISYSITYDLNGGELEIDNPNTYTIESRIVFNKPIKKGYAFIGWKDVATNESVGGIDIGQTGDKEYQATWVPISYSIQYILNGGHTSNPISYTIESEDIKLSDALKTFHKFKGWYLDSNYEKEITAIKKGTTGDLLLYAMWGTSTLLITISIIVGFSIIGIIVMKVKKKK